MKRLIELIKRHWLLLSIALFALILGVSLALQPGATTLSVISVRPPDGATVNPQSLTDVTITLSRQPTPGEIKNFQLDLSPSLALGPAAVKGDTLRFRVNGLAATSTLYTATLQFKSQTLIHWQFTTALPSGAGLGDPLKFQEIYQQDIVDYPLLVKTPYETADYTAFYSAPKTLTIKKKTGSTKTQTQMQREILLWIKSQSGDPDAHTIVFK